MAEGCKLCLEDRWAFAVDVRALEDPPDVVPGDLEMDDQTQEETEFAAISSQENACVQIVASG